MPTWFSRSSALLLVSASLGCSPPAEPAGYEVVAGDITSGAVYVLEAVHSGECVDVTGASTVAGANVEQWDCNNRPNQQFKFRAVSTGIYEVTAMHSGQCLDVFGASLVNGGNIDQWTCNGHSSQRWKVVSMGSGQYELQAVVSGKCMDVAGASTLRGANIAQWSCSGHANQRFTLTTVTGGGTGGSTGTGGATGGTTGTGGIIATGGSSGSGGTGGSKDAGAPSDGPPPDAAPAPLQCPNLVGARSKWVSVDGNGKLVYAPTATGDHIMDFSYAGYHRGGVALPVVPAVKKLQPSGGDDTPAIQAALNAVAALPLNGEVRGAVELSAGTFTLAGSLQIRASGVVLRGAGSGPGGTLLNGTGSPRVMITVAGSGSPQTVGTPVTITDAYVPSGARTFHVSDASAFKAGDTVLVGRPVTTEWIHFMGMDTLVRNGLPQTWISPGTVIKHDRVITAVSGNQITIDAPLSDSLDAQYVAPGATLAKYSFSGRIVGVGLEGFHIVVPGLVTAIDQPTFKMLNLDAAMNSWLKDLVGEGFVNSMSLGAHTKWITVQEVSLIHTAAVDNSAGYPVDFATSGTQALFLRCKTSAEQVFPFATMSQVSGPNVVLQMTSVGKDKLQPHMRWATGLLVDSTNVPTGAIEFINRGTAGSGHGWAIGWAVAWNSIAATLNIQQPPGAQNWAIGSSGNPGTSTGALDSLGVPVAPKSLYLQQLCERLGPQALTNIGYSSAGL